MNLRSSVCGKEWLAKKQMFQLSTLQKKRRKKKEREKSGYPSEEEMFAMYVKHVLPSPLLLSAQQLLQLEEALWTVNLLIYVNRVLPRFENNILAENRLPRV